MEKGVRAERGATMERAQRSCRFGDPGAELPGGAKGCVGTVYRSTDMTTWARLPLSPRGRELRRRSIATGTSFPQNIQ